MFTRSPVTSRPSATVSAPGGPDDRDAAANSPPETAAPTKSMATNNRPLPRNTVAKKRSSRWPTRSRITPMNHKKAMPANGTRFSAISTAARRRGSVSHAPGTLRIGRDSEPEQHERCNQEHRKDDPGDGRRPGCSQRAPGLQRTLNHISLGHRPSPSARWPVHGILSPDRINRARALSG